MYHQPLRLSVVVQAPLQRVENILLQNEHLKTLLDNEWIYLMVMDPLQQNKIKRYQKNLEWTSVIHEDLYKEQEPVTVENSMYAEILS